MESKKRKLPARASSRVEAASKKRTSTPPRAPTRPPSPTPVVVEEPLPKSIVPGKPLPTVEQQQPDDLSSSEYQSIAESRVMAESLDRSRKKWLSEGIFEKYWTKPSKKKAKDAGANAANEVKNPPKDSMTKIGQCTITIEPHVFDAIMYVVKDTTPKQPVPPQPQPLYRPIIQYGPPNGIVPQHPPPPPPPPLSVPQQPFAPMNTAPPPPQQPQPRPQDTSTTTQDVPPLHSHPPPLHTSVPPTPPQPHTTTAPPAPTPTDSSRPKAYDPVIQMLAERAATSPDLKALMRIVADGKATSAELRRFQAHIDELTKRLHNRQVADAQATSQPRPPPPAPPYDRPAGSNFAAPSPHQGPAQPPTQPRSSFDNQNPNPNPNRPAQTGPGQYTAPPPQPPQPQALRSKGPVSSKPELSCVVFEFVGGSGDRFLFPKYSILEYVPGGQVIASFLIVRKGSSGDSSAGYDPTLDYYQPVTIRLWTNGAGKQLESLAKVVKPQEEVRRYMDGIMEGMTRAEYVLLAMRLPREGSRVGEKGGEKEKEKDKDKEKDKEREKEKGEETGEIPADAVLWNTSVNQVNGGARPKAPTKGGVSEEERYKSYIRSIG